MEEIWKDVVGYEGYYQISDLGRVKSVGRWINVRGGGERFKKETINKHFIDRYGYWRIELNKDNVAKKYFIHVLVGKAFILNPNNLPEVNHEDGIKSNNFPTNLKWCDTTYNNRHARSTGLNDFHGEKHYDSRLTESQVLEIRRLANECAINNEFRRKKYPIKKWIKDFGITQGAFYAIIKRKTWKHI